jgi:hypothetical protein
LLVVISFAFVSGSLAVSSVCELARAQSIGAFNRDVSVPPATVSVDFDPSFPAANPPAWPSLNLYSPNGPADALGFEPLLPPALEPAGIGGNPKHEGVPWAAEWHQPPFSRIGIGANVSPLGIGIEPAIVLDQYFDARFPVNFLNYTSGRFEVDGFKINANLHMATAGASVDLYPWNSIWRLSAGLMFVNDNQISAATSIVPGTSFTLGTATYYSSTADPLTGSAVLGLHTVKPAPMASFGFGRFIPRSNRHWSFPSEFGVIYMGAPSLTVTTAGAVCTDKAQTMCSDVNQQGNPVGAAFNSNLQARLALWRKDLDRVKFYPIFSYSVVYSFNIR